MIRLNRTSASNPLLTRTVVGDPLVATQVRKFQFALVIDDDAEGALFVVLEEKDDRSSKAGIHEVGCRDQQTGRECRFIHPLMMPRNRAARRRILAVWHLGHRCLYINR